MPAMLTVVEDETLPTLLPPEQEEHPERVAPPARTTVGASASKDVPVGAPAAPATVDMPRPAARTATSVAASLAAAARDDLRRDGWRPLMSGCSCLVAVGGRAVVETTATLLIPSTKSRVG